MQVKAVVSHLEAARLTEYPITTLLPEYVTNNVVKPLYIYIPDALLTKVGFHFLSSLIFDILRSLGSADVNQSEHKLACIWARDFQGEFKHSIQLPS